jgi:hypothetical protein
LNNDFINSAFSADEKAMIPTVTVTADRNPLYITDPGKATQDKVFLLSITEANKYFSSYNAIQCKPTEYALEGGASSLGGNDNCYWWLRPSGGVPNSSNIFYGYFDGENDPDGTSFYAVYVDIGGSICEFGITVNDHHTAVRPAMWIDLNA